MSETPGQVLYRALVEPLLGGAYPVLAWEGLVQARRDRYEAAAAAFLAEMNADTLAEQLRSCESHLEFCLDGGMA